MTSTKVYEPQSIEQHWYHIWETKNYFSPSDAGKPYCIMLPPPNVTGSLHMGHGFGFTLMDILIRYHRMLGMNTLWQPGTDHAGIATQMVVERQLNLQGKTRHDLGRNAFVEKIWEWTASSGQTINHQLKRLGASLDWHRMRFSMDEDLSLTVRKVFIQLYDEGLIYRGKRLVNWDPVLLTAISDLEVTNQEEEGELWTIRYPLNEKEYVMVATTRPETLFGDVALAVHPEDERYRHLIGRHVHLPLTEKTIPIIADTYVDPLFGTGCVKITPAHDFNDYVVGMNHQLEPINIFTPDAHINDNAPKAFQGLDRFAARKKVINDLIAQNLLEKSEKYLIKVPRGDRSNAIIEPYLTSQWYVKSKALAEAAIHVVEEGEIRFVPENWSKTYFQWMNNIEDWCISRQLWWGHRIPVWYDENGKDYAGLDEKDVRQKYNLAKNISLKQDEDVLDTWFSAALWPFATLDWVEGSKDFATFFPTQVLVTGFDIIFFWVARMIMFSLKFTGQIPFREVYITGLIRDAEGQKMSKSKGNVLDPIDLIDGISLDALIQKRIFGLMQPKMAQKIEKATRKEFPDGIPSYGTDALRFTFCSLASFTREIRFDSKRLGGYRNFCNKLWNAARYVLMNTTTFSISEKDLEFSLADRWITSRLQHVIQEAHSALSQYRFDMFAHALYDFTWNEFCDWYLELSKPILTAKNSPQALLRGTQFTLLNVLENLLRLLHPIMPFITEEIWQRISPLLNIKIESIMIAPYPEVQEKLMDAKVEKVLEWLKKIVVAIRTIRSEMNIAPQTLVPILFRQGTQSDKQVAEDCQQLLFALAKLQSVTWLNANDHPGEAASAFIDQLEIYIPLAGLINKEEESARLKKEITKIEKEIKQIQNKINNAEFLAKAPAAIVKKEQEKFTSLEETLTKLRHQLAQLL